MDYESLEFHLKGAVPILFHNGQLASPLNEYSKAIKRITAKGKKKTEADLEEMAHLEFLGGLYLGDDGSPCVPGEVVEGMLVSAAKKERMGDQAKAGIVSDGKWPLLYDGPRKPEALWKTGRFHDIRGARPPGTRGTIQRCRPRFNVWEVRGTIQFLPELVNEGHVRQWLDIAGRTIGLGDYRPRFGRFTVVAVARAAA
jgi:hypothetical protein